MRGIFAALALLLVTAACAPTPAATEAGPTPSETTVPYDGPTQPRKIWLAGGCFWGVEAYFDRVPGVLETVSGYANGETDNPAYNEVVTGRTGHAETVQVTYDANRVSAAELVTLYLGVIDPYSVNRQGNDRGTQYRTGVYTDNARDATIVTAVLQAAENAAGGQPFAVEKEPLKAFFAAEEYHQDYLARNPGGYCHIDLSKGYASPWGDRWPTPDDEALKETLPPDVYRIVREKATEVAGTSALLKEDRPGLYVDVSNGAPLFVSSHKYESHCGWPSFTRPISPSAVLYVEDLSLGMARWEVLAAGSRAHLGHVFDDGPKEAGGLRYCINGLALRFIPQDEMEQEGYGDLIPYLE